jgi:hypothetical protein
MWDAVILRKAAYYKKMNASANFPWGEKKLKKWACLSPLNMFVSYQATILHKYKLDKDEYSKMWEGMIGTSGIVLTKNAF